MTDAITALGEGVNEAKLCWFQSPSTDAIIGEHALRIKQLKVLRH